MAITKIYSDNLADNYKQDNIINAIKQIQSIPILSGSLMDITVTAGTNVVPHSFKKTLIGLMIVNRNSYGDIRLVSSTQNDMTLNVENAGNYKIWVF